MEKIWHISGLAVTGLAGWALLFKVLFKPFFSALCYVVLPGGANGKPQRQPWRLEAGAFKTFARLGAILLGMTLAFPLARVQASPAPAKTRAPVIMVGDRLVDLAHGMGVIPAAMSVRCSLWPLCDQLKLSSQVLGCPGCLLKKKGAPLFRFAEKKGIRQVLIEKSSRFCIYKEDLDLEKIGTLAAEKGLEVRYVDFTRGLKPALEETAALLQCPGKAASLFGRYTKAMEKTAMKITGRAFPEKAVIIRGTYQVESGKTFLRVETPGGYADRFLLEPLGIRNVGDQVVPPGKVPAKGHITVRKLEGLIRAAPDALIIAGDTIAVQKAIHSQTGKIPGLAQVPALKHHAVYSLPGYVDASVLEYPLILRQWADVLAR